MSSENITPSFDDDVGCWNCPDEVYQYGCPCNPPNPEDDHWVCECKDTPVIRYQGSGLWACDLCGGKVPDEA